MYFEDPTRTIQVTKKSDLFVDDTATGVSASAIHDERNPIEHLQEDEQKHAFLLYSTGHMLALYKCLFYFYKFCIKGTKFVHTKNSDCPGELHIRPKYGGHLEKIRRLEPDEAHKTLGCHPAVSGSQKDQFKVLQKYIKQWVRKIQSAPLSKEDKVKAYRTYLEMKLLYVLPTCSFTYRQCQELDKIIRPILFNAHGIQRHCNQSVMYLTDSLGGLKIMSIYHLQGYSKMQFFCMHTRNMDTIGKLLTISSRYTQLECGLSKSYFKYDYYDVQHLVTTTWSTNIWQYITECKSTLHDYDEWTYKQPRKNDFFLMDAILRSNIPIPQQEIFNRVRINLRLLTASDIVVCNSGTKLLPNILQGINHRHSSFSWPVQQDLPKRWMDIFYSIVKSEIYNQIQSIPLGQWISDGHQCWNYYMTEEKTIVQAPYGTKNPSHTKPVDVCLKNKIKIIGVKDMHLQNFHDPISQTLSQAIQNAPKWLSQLWRTSKWKAESLDKIIDNINKGTLVAAGKGAIRNQWGSYHWCFVEKNGLNRICTRCGPVDGDPSSMKIFRASATYVLSALSIIDILSSFAQNKIDHIYVYTDCKSLTNLTKVSNINRPSWVLSDHMDIVYQIRAILHKHPNIRIEYIAAACPRDDIILTPMEKLMDKMHCGAITYFSANTNVICPHNVAIGFPAQRFGLYLKDVPIVTKIPESLQESERQIDREEYFYTKFGIMPENIPTIDSYTLGRVFQRNKHRHFAYSKIIHSQLNTMTVNKKWNVGTDLCPVCYTEVEDWQHVLTCTSDDMTRVRKDFLSDFCKSLNKHRTYPPLRDFLLDCFTYPNFHDPPQPLIANPRYIQLFHEAFTSQTSVGWSNFYRGFISKGWKQMQYKYYLEIVYRDIHAVDKWCRMLISNILEFSRIQWNERCKIVAAEKEFSYDGRTRKQLIKLCTYLQQNPDLIPTHKQHLIQKETTYFQHQHLDNILMWKRHIDIVLDPQHVSSKSKITQHFLPPKPIRKRKKVQTTTKQNQKSKRRNVSKLK